MSYSPLFKSLMRKRYEGTLSYTVYVNTMDQMGLHVRKNVACTCDYEDALEQQVKYTINEMYGKYICNENTLIKLRKRSITWSRKMEILRIDLNNGLEDLKLFKVGIKARKTSFINRVREYATNRNKIECRSINDYTIFYYRCKHQLGFLSSDNGPLIYFL